MKYTIAIPSHNRYNPLKRCLDSVFRLKFDDYEVVVSDTSTDNLSWEYLKEIQKQHDNMRIFQNDQDWDMWQNHNFCLDAASGKYVIFIHTDDMLLPEALQIFDKYMKKLGYPEKIFMFGRSLYNDYAAALPNKTHSINTVIAGVDAVACFVGGGLTPSGTLMSKEFIDLGGYLKDDMIPPHSDCISMLNCAFHGYKFFMFPDMVFVRECGGTVYKKLDKENVKQMCKYLETYFTEDQLKILIRISDQYDTYDIAKFLCANKRLRRMIMKNHMRKAVRRPLRGGRRLIRICRFCARYI